MANVVSVLLVELVVCEFVERAAPEHETFLEVEPNALEEKRVLETSEMLEVGIFAERAVQMGHACREVLGDMVNVGGGDLCANKG
jgi:hypothetical protein